MITRRLGSPAMPVLGGIVVTAAVIASLWFAVSDIRVVYMRWPDLAYRLRAITTIASFGVGAVSAYNAAALSAQGLFTASSLGKYPLARQLVRVALTVALLTLAAILIGYSPAVVIAALQTQTLPLAFVGTVASLAFFLVTIAAVSALLGVTLRKVHPLIASVIALLFSYFVAAFAANETTAWAVFPINQITGLHSVLFEKKCVLAAAIATLLVTSILLITLAAIAKAVTANPSPAKLAVRSAGIVAAVGFAALGQSMAGGLEKTDDDRCRETGGGSVVCVDASDEPGLQMAIDDLDAIDSFTPMHAQPTQFAELQSYHLGDPSYQAIEIQSPNRRIDVSERVLENLGLDSCTDPLSEGAKVIDRVGVYAVKQTGTYSQIVAENGAFYYAFDEAGNKLVPEDELSKLPPEVANERIAANIDAITTCHGTFEMLGVPAPQ